MNLRGRRVMVTGAGRGIGRALAERFAEVGSEVALADIEYEPVDAAAAAICASGGAAVAVEMDVADTASIAAAHATLADTGGPLDVLVNNAGIVQGGGFLDVPVERHLRTYDVNTLGLVAVTHAFLPGLIERPQARIVNIASASGFIPLPFGATYGSSKWAAVGFSESLRIELRETGHRHIGVTTVCPGYVDTGMFTGVRPPRFTRMLSPDRLARIVVAAVERERDLVRTPWLVKLGGPLYTLLPAPAFDVIGRWFGIHDTMREWQGHDPPQR